MQINNMKHSNNWTYGHYFWIFLMIWFCANILSQAAFIGKYGKPYGSDLLNQEFGILYWVLILLELSIYLLGFYLLRIKIKDKKTIITS